VWLIADVRKEFPMSGNPVQFEEFVSNAIPQIMRAISKASPEVHSLGGDLNPRPLGEGNELAQAGVARAVGGGLFVLYRVRHRCEATKGSGGESGVGVIFAAIGAGMKEKNNFDSQTVS
jgi:hypothetical protein